MESNAKLGPRLGAALIAVSVVAVAAAFYGWSHEGLGWVEAAYRAFKSLGEGEAYNEIAERHHDDAYLEAARWLGLAVTAVAVALVFISIFRHPWRRFMVRLFKHGHVVVVGDSRFAGRLTETGGRSMVHLCRSEDAEGHAGLRPGLVRLPFEDAAVCHGAERVLREAAAHRASHIVIATDRDSDGVNLGLAAARLFGQGGPATTATPAQVIVRLHDYYLAQRLQELPGAERLRATSEPNLTAIYAVRRYPPFLIAQDKGHDHIHAVLIGDHDWLEAMMSESLLSAITSRLGRMAFTFFCPRPVEFKARLHHRYPELVKQADLAFHATEVLDHGWIFDIAAARIEALGPVTCVYSLSRDAGTAMTGALSFAEQARPLPSVRPPIFVLVGDGPEPKDAPGRQLADLEFIQLGRLDEMVQASGLLAQEADRAEREYHEAYQAFSDPGGVANTGWAGLSEEFRMSNRRAIRHLYAKLFDAGFDLRDWMARHPGELWTRLPQLSPGETLFRTPQERDRMATLEHDRWQADRRLGGWRYGPQKDARLKLHPDLVPFDQVPPGTQDYDRKFIDFLAQRLTRTPGDLRRGAA